MPSEISLSCTVGFSFAVASQILAKFATTILIGIESSDVYKIAFVNLGRIDVCLARVFTPYIGDANF